MHRLGVFAVALFAAATWSAGAYAAPSGNGNGKGSGGGGGGSQAPDLGDLYVLFRDANGIPILTPEACRQPLAAPGVALPAMTAGDAAEAYAGCTPSSSTESCVIPVEPQTCAILPGYEQYAQEVDFGRTSVMRAPTTVLDSQLEEAEVGLATASCKSLDPSGRLVLSTVHDDGTVTSGAIDSPTQNLAIYRQLMLDGYLGTVASPIGLPGGNGQQNVLDTAARSLGAAADKTGKVTMDMVVYANQILGLTDETVSTYLPKQCIEVKEEVNGVVKMVRKCYLLYSAYSYNRTNNFGSLPDPAYIPASGPADGWFEYLAVQDPALPTFRIERGPILDAVPQLSADKTFTAQNIRGFAQAADDARAVIDFAHTWPVPGDYATPVPCTSSGTETHSDVSISDKSGLEVPVRMVAGTEGREFTLTVANAGPDAATGTATLDAVDSTGAEIPTFPRSFTFDITAGSSQAWTGNFTVDYPTTITWTATARAANDVNAGNDSVTETTEVRQAGGGGNSGHRGGGGG